MYGKPIIDRCCVLFLFFVSTCQSSFLTTHYQLIHFHHCLSSSTTYKEKTKSQKMKYCSKVDLKIIWLTFCGVIYINILLVVFYYWERLKDPWFDNFTTDTRNPILILLANNFCSFLNCHTIFDPTHTLRHVLLDLFCSYFIYIWCWLFGPRFKLVFFFLF